MPILIHVDGLISHRYYVVLMDIVQSVSRGVLHVMCHSHPEVLVTT